MDVTPALSSVGRLIIVALMYVGRTGPLTLALAIGERPSKGQYRLPAETVMVG